MTCFSFYYVHRKCRLLGTGSAPKVTSGKGCTPKKLGQVSWDPDLQLGKFWQKNRLETAEFPGESPSPPAAFWVGFIQKALTKKF